MLDFFVVVPRGFEPRQTEPKPVVLPLHHRTILCAFFWKSCAKISPFGGKYKFFPILLPRKRKRESEAIDCRNYFFNLVVGEQGVQRQAQFLGRKSLGNGAREAVPLRIALLFVGRQRIVYLCLDSERG